MLMLTQPDASSAHKNEDSTLSSAKRYGFSEMQGATKVQLLQSLDFTPSFLASGDQSNMGLCVTCSDEHLEHQK